MTAVTTQGGPGDRALRMRMRRGVLRLLWWRHRVPLLAGVAVWFLGLFVFQLLTHGGLVLAGGCIYALLLGTRVGGTHTGDGSEEYTFALPLRRADRLWLQYLSGFVPLVALVLSALAVLVWDLSPGLWSLVVDSGFTAPFRPGPAILRWYVALVPPALYTASFFLAILAREPRTVGNAGLGGLFLVGLPVLGCLLVGAWLEFEHRLELGLVVAASIGLGVLVSGGRRHLRKEGIQGGAVDRGGGVSPLVLVILLGLFLFLIAMLSA